MTTLPTYMWLSGDEDGGVTFVCDHVDHRPQTVDDLPNAWGFAYHAGHGESGANGMPYFSSRDLAGFIDFINRHAAGHRAGA